MYSLFNEKIQGKENLFKLLEANDEKTTIAVFDTYPIYEQEVPRLVKIINTNTHLKALKLLDCRLTAEDSAKIVSAVLQNKTLEEVKIELFADDSPQLRELMTAMQTHLAQNINPLDTAPELGSGP